MIPRLFDDDGVDLNYGEFIWQPHRWFINKKLVKKNLPTLLVDDLLPIPYEIIFQEKKNAKRKNHKNVFSSFF